MPQGRSGTGTRPTTDRVRESLFNVLSARLDLTDAVVLDLYAGSGALGLEALSRGASSALFVESDRRAAAVLAENVRSLGATGAVVRQAAVATVLASGAGRTADVVFADPPYDVPSANVEAVLALLVERGWVGDGALVVVERPAAGPGLTWPLGWIPAKHRRYGDTRLELAVVA